MITNTTTEIVASVAGVQHRQDATFSLGLTGPSSCGLSEYESQRYLPGTVIAEVLSPASLVGMVWWHRLEVP